MASLQFRLITPLVHYLLIMIFFLSLILRHGTKSVLAGRGVGSIRFLDTTENLWRTLRGRLFIMESLLRQ